MDFLHIIQGYFLHFNNKNILPWRHLVTIMSKWLIRNTFVSGSVRCLLATLMHFVYLRSVVDSCSIESNSDSDCD